MDQQSTRNPPKFEPHGNYQPYSNKPHSIYMQYQCCHFTTNEFSLGYTQPCVSLVCIYIKDSTYQYRIGQSTTFIIYDCEYYVVLVQSYEFSLGHTQPFVLLVCVYIKGSTYQYRISQSTTFILYKMKYWRAINFGDWRLLDKIANI